VGLSAVLYIKKKKKKKKKTFFFSGTAKISTRKAHKKGWRESPNDWQIKYRRWQILISHQIKQRLTRTIFIEKSRHLTRK
jgi:hypothetical protein